MPQKQKKPKAKRKTKKEKLEFDPGMVFDVESASDLTLTVDQEEDLSRFKARKGQGGSRRST
jgi:hypothetical protein